MDDLLFPAHTSTKNIKRIRYFELYRTQAFKLHMAKQTVIQLVRHSTWLPVYLCV